MSKLSKQVPDSLTFVINFTNLLGVSEILSSATPITVNPISSPAIGIASQQINSGVINGIIQVGKAVQFIGSAGADGYEYILETVGTSNLGFTYDTEVVLLVLNSSELIIDYYGNILRANTYFKQRIDSSAWTGVDNPSQRRALYQATQIIDRLNFKGTKTDPNQYLEFPRQGQVLTPTADPYTLNPTSNWLVYTAVIDTNIPKAIEYACYEIAYALLDGIDPDKEIENLAATGHHYSSVRTTYERTRTLEHIIAGVPSYRAWTYLRPYLRDGRSINFSRVN